MDNGAESYRRFLLGDDEGMVEIIRDYKDGLIYYLNSFVNNVHTAEDLAEDVFVKLVTKKPKYKAQASFKTWLYIIGRNLAVDYLRKAAKRHEEPLDDHLNLASEEEELLNAVIKEERSRQLHNAMKKLSDLHCEVLTLYYFNELNTDEIAQILGNKKHAVEALLTRARKALREELISEGFEYEGL